MKNLLLIAVLGLVLSAGFGRRLAVLDQNSAVDSPQSPAAGRASIPADQQNAHQARELLDQALQALGGQAYLDVHDMQEQGRTYSFHHGTPTSNGVFFWRFIEYPDKERVELTPQRDIAYVYSGGKGYEVTYKGPRAVEKKIWTTTPAATGFLWKSYCEPGSTTQESRSFMMAMRWPAAWPPSA